MGTVFKPMTLLLIEDEANERGKYNALSEKRRDVEFVGMVNSSFEGVRYATIAKPEGVILDLELSFGEGSGTQFLKDIKNNEIERKPIIIVTTNTPSGLVHDHVRSLGADYIFYKKQKGFSPETVINMMLDLRQTLYGSLGDENEEGVANLLPETEEELHKRIKSMIENELDKLGVNAKYRGRTYMEEAILFIIKEGLDKAETALYVVATQEKVTYSTVFRSIQTAINNTWLASSLNDLLINYTARIDVRTGVPSPTELIYFYADKVKKAV